MLSGVVLAASPSMNSARISPSLVFTNDTLTGYCNATDSDGDNVSYYHRWYNQTSLVSEGNNGFTIFSNANDTATSSINNPGNAIDNNYGTASTLLSTPAAYYFNVTYPFNTTVIYWETKTSAHGTINVSIPDHCRDYYYNVSALRYHVDNQRGAGDYPISLQCFNGTWHNLTTVDDVSFSFYEERTYFLNSFKQNIESQATTLSSASTNVGDRWIFSCLATDGSTNSSWLNSTAESIDNGLPKTPRDLSFTWPMFVTETITPAASGSTDPDGDPIAYYYLFRNVNDASTVQDWSTSNSYTIQSSDAHDDVTVSVMATDNLEKDLVLHYNMSNFSQDMLTVHDLSGQGNDGTLSGYTLNHGTLNGGIVHNATGGKYGGAYEFNGTNYIATPQGTIFDGALGFSVSLWAKTKVDTVTVDRVLLHLKTTGGSTTFYVLQDNTGSGNIITKMYNATAAGKSEATQGMLVKDRWIHYGFVRLNDGSIKIYRNGTHVDSDVGIPGILREVGQIIISDSTNDFNGSIDNVMIWNRSLSDNEMLDIYENSSKFGIPPEVSDKLVYLNIFESQYDNSTHTMDTNFLVSSTNTSQDVDLKGAMRFDGVDDYVQLSQIRLNYTEGYMITAWTRRLDSTSTSSIIGRTNAGYNYFVITAGEDIYLESNTNNNRCYTSGNPYPTDGAWHFVTVSVDNGNCQFSLDGINITSLTDSTITDKIYLSRIGTAGGSNWWNGSIDEVMIYNRTLSPEEITMLYQIQKGSFTDTYNETFTVNNSVTKISNVNISLVDLHNGSQRYNVTYSVSDLDPDTITCNFTSTDENITLTLNGAGNECSGLASLNQSATNSFYAETYDGYDENLSSKSEGVEVELDSYIIDTSSINTLSAQHFVRKYNLTNNLSVNYSNIQWSISTTDSIKTINLTSGTTLQNSDTNVTEDYIEEDAQYTISGNTFVIDQAYNIYKNFVYNNTQTVSLPEITLNIPLVAYVANYLAEWQNGILWPDINSTYNGSHLSFNLTSLNALNETNHRYSYDATVASFTGESIADYTLSGEYRQWTLDRIYYFNFPLFDKTLTQNIGTDALTEWVGKTATWTSTMTENITGGSYSHTTTDHATYAALSFANANYTANYTYQILYYTLAPISGGDAGGGGGGGGGIFVEETVSNETIEDIVEKRLKSKGYIQFAFPGHTRQIPAFPTDDFYKEVVIKAVGGPVENATLQFSDNIGPYFTGAICDLRSDKCYEKISLEEDEEKYVFMLGNLSNPTFMNDFMSEGSVKGYVQVLSGSSPDKSLYNVTISKTKLFDPTLKIAQKINNDSITHRFVYYVVLALIFLAIGILVYSVAHFII